MATSDFTITVTFQGATQAEANTRRDNGVGDYARSRALPIFEADGVTLKSNAVVATLVRDDVKARLREDVINYRQSVASNAAVAPVKAAVILEIP
jgi:hypothetical protein